MPRFGGAFSNYFSSTNSGQVHLFLFSLAWVSSLETLAAFHRHHVPSSFLLGDFTWSSPDTHYFADSLDAPLSDLLYVFDAASGWVFSRMETGTHACSQKPEAWQWPQEARLLAAHPRWSTYQPSPATSMVAAAPNKGDGTPATRLRWCPGSTMSVPGMKRATKRGPQ